MVSAGVSWLYQQRRILLAGEDERPESTGTFACDGLWRLSKRTTISMATKEDYLRRLIEDEGLTSAAAADRLRQFFPYARGLSDVSVRRFCSSHGIRRPLSTTQLDGLVTRCVAEVGPTFGRRMLKGLLHARGITVGERRIGSSLKRCAPAYNEARRRYVQFHVNPVPYYAQYFGHKVHLDQNEKLGMYGVTHVVARDGYSGMIVGFSTAIRPV